MVRLSFCYPFHPSWGIWSFLFSSVIAPLQSLAGRALCPLLYCNRKGKTRTTLFLLFFDFSPIFLFTWELSWLKLRRPFSDSSYLILFLTFAFPQPLPTTAQLFLFSFHTFSPHFWVLPWSFSFPSQSVASTVLPVWKIICVAIVVLYFQQLLCWLLCKEGNKMKSLPAYRHFILSRSKHRQLRS